MKKTKRLIALLLCVILIIPCLASCNTTKEDAPKGTELTLENIDDYIELSGTIKAGSMSGLYKYNGEYVDLYSDFSCSMTATGNSHYKYEDVVIEIRFWHVTPLTDGSVSSETTVSLKLNLAGNGEVSCKLDTPAKIAKDKGQAITPIMNTFYSYKGISSSLDKTYYEIVNVTGTVTEY